ncbi:MAG: WecB/TagA/CpsF family glycosyltransferase [Planctomycetes bacterium]|nr:WecB/TagA/CpsF family glycosyltransferase [Planctomycetota bacterium]
MSERVEPIWVWGLPLMPYTLAESLERIAQLIKERQPNFIITANLHYAMITDADRRLRELNAKAAFILADGMPLVWASRLMKRRLPERVAGSDLVWKVCEQGAKLGHRVFLLGGAPGIADAAAETLRTRYPGLVIAGTVCPPFRELSAEEETALIEQIRSSGADILLLALGQPKGELWTARTYERLGVPICLQIGASLDFVAGKVKRAPRWVQKIGLEWLYRLLQEPRRLLGRYLSNIVFLLRMVCGGTRRWGRVRKLD